MLFDSIWCFTASLFQEDECDEFVACLEDGRHPTSDGRVGARVVRTLEALTRSMDNEGREEKVEGIG